MRSVYRTTTPKAVMALAATHIIRVSGLRYDVDAAIKAATRRLPRVRLYTDRQAFVRILRGGDAGETVGLFRPLPRPGLVHISMVESEAAPWRIMAHEVTHAAELAITGRFRGYGAGGALVPYYEKTSERLARAAEYNTPLVNACRAFIEGIPGAGDWASCARTFYAWA